MRYVTDFLASEVQKDPSLIPGIQMAELRILLAQLIYSSVYDFGYSRLKLMRYLHISPFTLHRILDGNVPFEGEELLKFALRVVKFYTDQIGLHNSDAKADISRVESIVHKNSFATV